jgi:hypothetical protein
MVSLPLISSYVVLIFIVVEWPLCGRPNIPWSCLWHERNWCADWLVRQRISRPNLVFPLAHFSKMMRKFNQSNSHAQEATARPTSESKLAALRPLWIWGDCHGIGRGPRCPRYWAAGTAIRRRKPASGRQSHWHGCTARSERAAARPGRRATDLPAS